MKAVKKIHLEGNHPFPFVHFVSFVFKTRMI